MAAEHGSSAVLGQAVVLLGALALAGPAARLVRTSAVLAYLVAGVLIGPYGLGRLVPGLEAGSIRGLAEFGVVLLLFLIGLELRPKRLWAMRSAVFGIGTLQVAITAGLLAMVALSLGLGMGPALFVGLALSLSSTALALQVLEEKKEMQTRHGRSAFSVLLMQDLVSIPLIALAPLFAVAAVATSVGSGAPAMQLGWRFAAEALAMIALVVVAGRLVVGRVYRLAAASGVKEATSAAALLTVAAVALAMALADLSPALGAFIAGALLADSEFRHDIEANIQPFEGLLLGLFFTVIGMSLELALIIERPIVVLAGVVGLVALKAAVLYGLGRWSGLDARGSRRFAIATSQGGEFAFVLFAAGVAASVMAKDLAGLLAVIVTLSMVATPVLMALESRLAPPKAAPRTFDEPQEEQGHVIIAGFGRFGQIVARVLTARGIPFVALDGNVDQVDFVRRFGGEVYYGDATRLDLLHAARADKARAFVIAIDDVDASLKAAELVRRHYPELPVFARARNRQHVYKLMDLGVEKMRRETFLASLDLTRLLLVGLGTSESEATRLTETFKEHDRKRLYADYAHHNDFEKMTRKSREAQKELEELFQTDKADAAAKGERAEAARSGADGARR